MSIIEFNAGCSNIAAAGCAPSIRDDHPAPDIGLQRIVGINGAVTMGHAAHSFFLSAVWTIEPMCFLQPRSSFRWMLLKEDGAL